MLATLHELYPDLDPWSMVFIALEDEVITSKEGAMLLTALHFVEQLAEQP